MESTLQKDVAQGLASQLKHYVHLLYKSQGSSVSTVSDYGLDDQGSIPDTGRGFFF
jgi:hypothetical protein